MKKLIVAASFALLALSLGNNPAWSQPSKETLQNKSITHINGFFPRVEGSFVGDPMPVFNDGKFDIYYLNDIRGGSDLGYMLFISCRVPTCMIIRTIRK